MKYLEILLFLIGSNFLFGQNSFVKEINSEFEIPIYKFEIGSDNQLSLLDFSGFFNPNEMEFRIQNLSSKGDFESGYSIRIDSVTQMPPNVYYNRKEEHNLISFAPLTSNNRLTPGISYINFVTNSNWARKTASSNISQPLPSSILLKNNLVVSVIDSSKTFIDFPNYRIAAFDLLTGSSVWSYRYYSTLNTNGELAFERISEYPNGNISLIIYAEDEGGISHSGLAIFTPSGELLENIIFNESFENLGFVREQNHGIDDLGNVYLTGLSDKVSGNKNPFIAKFDSNLDLVWAKKLFAENFPYEGLKHRVFPNGEVIFVYNTDGDLPVIVGKLDPDGNLLWHRGYSFFNPEIQIGSDGSIYFLSAQKYLPDGTTEPATLLAKADPNGDIDSCPQFDACLTLFDMDIPYERWDWIREPADTFGSYNATITPFTTTTEDYCGTPAKPTAFFTVPDTICQSTILEPDSLNNALAHGVEWTITGQNTDLEIEDDTWQYQFTDPGTYQIEQEVWLLGCAEFYTKTLTVLKDSLGDLLGDNRLICEGDSIVLIPEGARPLRTFDWSDGSTDSSVIISESGVYEVEVSDGFCSIQDEVSLTFIEDRYPEPIIDLQTDSTLCIDLLPLVLAPTSIYTDSFYFENANVPQSVFELNAAGNYSIETQIENCRIKQNFELKISPCEVDIFIPNSFSPNDDGINDFAEPLGKDFTGLGLEIYNRWGGKVFETTTAPFVWDGKCDSKKANEGIYVLVFKYQNQRTGKEEVISGDVLLIR